LGKKEKRLFDEICRGTLTSDGWLLSQGGWGALYFNAFFDDDREFLRKFVKQTSKKHIDCVGFELKAILKDGDGIIVDRVFADLTENFRIWIKAEGEMFCFNAEQFKLFKKIVPHNVLILVKIPKPDKIYGYVGLLYFVNQTDRDCLTYGLLTSYIDLRFKISVDFDRIEYLRNEIEKMQVEAIRIVEEI
jgi:hypothetical protein